MAINGGAGGKRVIKGDGGGGAPTDDVGVNGVAVGVVTDGAFASVASQIGNGFVARWFSSGAYGLMLRHGWCISFGW